MSAEPLQVTADERERVENRRRCPEVTASVDAEIRTRIETVIVAVGSLSNGKRMHIPDGDTSEALCQRHKAMSSPERKSIECFPAGHREFCRECAARFRIKHGGVEDAD